MEYLMLLFTLFLLHSAESYAASDRYVEYYNNNHSGDTNNNDAGKPVKPYTLSASYEVTEKIDDIPDNRPKPGPVIPNYTVRIPINFAQNNRNNNKNNYDSEAESNSADDNNSGTKKKHFHKYDRKVNWSGIKGKERFSKGNDEDDLSEYFEIDDYDDNDTEARAGFYDSLKEVVSDFKNKISKSFKSFFGNDDHSI